jgi:hypothetical protein
MKKCTLLLTLMLGLSIHLFAQTSASLYIQHPQQTWKSGAGTIEEATVAMTPNGALMKFDVTMTFSARSLTVFTQSDSVEVNFNFPLPADAVVNDLWLWVGKDVSRGLILDRSIASSTYESIVKRRRDPAFLQKTSATSYGLQIYPMVASGSRKVKFSFNLPLRRMGTQWYATVVSALFRQSLAPLQSLRLIYYAPSASHVPTVLNDTRYTFTPWTDSLSHGAAWKCDIPNTVFVAGDPTIGVPMPAGNNFVFTQLADPSGGTYHLLLDPFALLEVTSARKFVIMFDYDSIKTSYTRTAFVEAAKTMLATTCTAKDSFNVIFNDWQRSGEKWIAADSAGIASAFRTLGAASIPEGSNIPGLFMNAVDFLKSGGTDASILLLAASDKLGNPALGDPVLSWLRVKLPAGIGIHIIDAMNRNGNYYYSGGTYLYGNKYFYEAVKAFTGGSLRTVNTSETLAATLGGALQSLRGGLTSLDIQVRYANGFTYSKYSYGIVPFQSVLNSQLVGQVGKYAGTGPITLELGGFYRGQPYQKKIAIPDAAILPADSSLRATWVGRYLADIEWLTTNTTDVIKTIVDECVKERVVCRYTALLALEPGDTLVVSTNDKRVVLTHTTATPTLPVSYAIAEAYPNPFNPSTTLRVRLPEGVTAQNATMHVYNVLGQIVKTFDASGLTSGAAKEFRWDAVDDAGRRVTSGMYLFVVTTPGARYTVKLMLLK